MSHRGADLRVAGSLQGLAAIVYLLSSIGTVLPLGALDDVEPLDGIFRSGNLALAVFFAAFGYTLTVELRSAREVSLVRMLRACVRVVLPAVVAMLLVTVAVLAVTRYDDTDTTSTDVTRSSLLHAWTFLQNGWILDHLLLVRSDVSSLWIVSLLVQYAVVLAVAVAILGRRRWFMAALALACVVGSIIWRAHLLTTEGWVQAALDSVSRSDALAMGVVAACLAGVPAVSRAVAGQILGGATMVLFAGVIVTSFVGVDAIFTVVLPLGAGLTALSLWAAGSDPDPRGLATQALLRPELVQAGGLALPLLVWSPFVAATATRHEGDHPSTLIAVLVGVVSLIAAGATWALLARGPSWAREHWTARRSTEVDSVQRVDHT
ncbi:MAG: hypothetical protein JWR55_3019 [Aeromicrobium sp.]|jgi:peptidoglycan/LPS O-acetylase OafA/YrhL|nr:hypothetical protein [Aeromicrobium sp.]